MARPGSVLTSPVSSGYSASRAGFSSGSGRSYPRILPKTPKWKLGRILAGVRNTIRAYFDSLRHKEAAHYQKFAGNIAHCGDVVLTFNYDVLLERELRQARKWEIGDGYGFEVCTGLPASPVMLLKLHGSTTWSGLMFEGKSVMHGQGPLQSLGKRPVICNMHSLTTNFGTDVSTQTFGQWTGGVTAPRNVQMGLKVVF
jgi:hypothetical protein